MIKKQNEVLSIDGAAERVLAALDKAEPGTVKRPVNRGHGATAHLARALEIPPHLVTDAGDAAGGAMQAIKQALDASSGGLRQNYLVQAQRNIDALDTSRHGTLVRHLQARVLALQGRGGDTRIAHVTPGELVIPERLQTPAVMGALRVAAMHAGIDPDRLEVGRDSNSINPETGEPEFADVIDDKGIVESISVAAYPDATPRYYPLPGGIRGSDVKGNGAFDASRGTRRHEGIDLVANPGENVVSPVDGVVRKTGYPYMLGDKKTPDPRFHSVEIEPPDGNVTRLYYVKPSVKVGDKVVGGVTPIGKVEDLAPKHPGITNHVHLEIRDPKMIGNPNAASTTNRYMAINPLPFLRRYPGDASK